MKSLRILLGVATVAAMVFAIAPAANAQCVPAQVFASLGLGMAAQTQRLVDAAGSGAFDGGAEHGRFWSAGTGLNNNFGGGCPSTNGADSASSWWNLNNTATLRGINGAIGGGGVISPCAASGCPNVNSDQQIVLVEDYSAAPPAIGGTAYFLVWRVDATAADPRTWNYARLNGSGTNNNDGLSNLTVPFLQFPSAVVTASNRNGARVNITSNYADMAPNFDGVSGPPANAALPATGTILSYDICLHNGPSDPGRDRSAWNGGCPLSVAYPGAGVVGDTVNVDCPDENNDMWVAIGATFDAGVPSMLVGSAIQVECNPNLADPEEDQRRKPGVRKHKQTRSQSR